MKYLILLMALCTGVSFCSAPSKADDKMKQESEDVEYGDLTEQFGELSHTVIVKSAPHLSSTQTPPVSVEPTPATTPRQLLKPILNPNAQLLAALTQVAQPLVNPIADPVRKLAIPKHKRAQSGPVNAPVNAAAPCTKTSESKKN